MSALSAALTAQDWNGEIGKHAYVKHGFVKRVYQLGPSYQQTCGVAVVLNYLDTLHPPSELTLKSLTLKFVMLTGLITGQRGQCFHFMDTKDTTRNRNGYRFVIRNKDKSGPGRLQPEVILPEFKANPKLCVVLVIFGTDKES